MGTRTLAATVTAAGMRYEAISRRLPEPSDGRVLVAEIGVWDGSLSELLLTRQDVVLMMVDSWAPQDARRQSYLNSGDIKASASDEAMAMAKASAIARTGFAMHRAQVYHLDSVDAASKVRDHSLDMVFIDGDHSFEGVARDIEAWKPKVKYGGWIGGHDYGDPAFPGVRQAVRLFWDDVETDMNLTWFKRL